MMAIAMVITMIGYTIADMTLFLILVAFSWNSARRGETNSSTPPTSPALTMLT